MDVQGGAGGASGGGKEDQITNMISEFLAKLPEQFNMMEIVGRLTEGKGKEREKTPEIIVCF